VAAIRWGGVLPITHARFLRSWRSGTACVVGGTLAWLLAPSPGESVNRPNASGGVALAAQQKGRRQEPPTDVEVEGIARATHVSPSGQKKRYLKVVLRLRGAEEVSAARWRPLTAAKDDTGLSLLPGPSVGIRSVSPGVTTTVLGLGAHKGEYALRLPAPTAKRIALLAGQVRLALASGSADARFENPLGAGRRTLRVASRNVTLESLTRHNTGVRGTLQIKPPVMPFASGTDWQGFSMTWEAKSTKKSGSADLGGTQPQFVLVLADGTSRPANMVKAQTTRGASAYEVEWSEIAKAQAIRALLCRLRGPTTERPLSFRLTNIALP